jgi:hypothetical protein
LLGPLVRPHRPNQDMDYPLEVSSADLAEVPLQRIGLSRQAEDGCLG